MSLQIEQSISDKLPAMVKQSLANVDSNKQSMFVEEYKRKSKSTGLMVFLAIFFPIQLFLLGKTGLGIAFILTAGAFGIWYVIEWFITPKRVSDYNNDIASAIMRDIKIMS